MKKIISTLLALVMVVSLAACGGEEKPVSQESSSAGTGTRVERTEPVTITLMPLNGNLTSGVVGGWLGDYLLEHNIILDVWAYSADKVNSILASGDFPDVMYFNKKVDLNALAEGGYLLDLNEYRDELLVFQDENYEVAINYADDNLLDKTDKLVVIPTGVGPGVKKINTGGTCISLNWEVYEQIGSPEVNNWEDTIDVFKKMQEAWPVSDTGVKTYAMHLYGGADNGSFAGVNNILKLEGYSTNWLKWFMVANTRTNELEYMLEDDGIYKFALKYMNTLYREGLLDPDSITYDRKTVIGIVDTEGSTLAGWTGVAAYESKGFMPLYFDGMRVVDNGQVKPLGLNSLLGVSSKCKNIDAVIDLFNLFTDPESALVIKNGPEGELWEYDESGTPVLTEKGYGYFVNGEPALIGDEPYALFNTGLFPSAGYLTEQGRTVHAVGWPEVTENALNTDVANRWKEHYGGVADFQELLGEDLVTFTFDELATNFIEELPKEEELLWAAAQDVIINASWRMVYAESDDAFEKIWDEAVKECEEIGVKEMAKVREESIWQAIEYRDSLGNLNLN